MDPALLMIGLLLVFVGFMILIIGLLLSGSGETRVEGGGVVVIGPIPIVFASNTRIAIVLMILAIILIVLSYLLFYYPGLRPGG